MNKMRIKRAVVLFSLVFLISIVCLSVNSQVQEFAFDVVLNFSLVDNENLSQIIISSTDSPDGSSNPLKFAFDVGYNNTEDLECNFSVDSLVVSQDLTNKSLKISLLNGAHQAVLNCEDSGDSSINAQKIVSFAIDEDFTTSLSKEVYLLDGEGNLIGGTGTFRASSAKNSGINIKIHKPSSSNYDEDLQDKTSHAITLNSNIIDKKGTYTINTTFYRLASPVSVEDTFYVAKASLSFDEEDVVVGEEVAITAEIDSPKKIKSLIVDFGDGDSNTDYFVSDFTAKTINFYHEYEEPGDYTVELKITIQDSGDVFIISKNGISVENTEDNQEPSVSMIYPANNAELYEDSLTLKYKAEDNIKIKNCTFELYNYSGGVGTLDYSKTHEDLDNNQEVSISLKNFRQGEYSWNVYCCDNSSNCNDDLEYYREFSVNLNSTTVSSVSEEFNYSQKQEVDELISKANEFVSRMNLYSAEEKQILEDLEISKNVEFYRRRLNQIDQDLGHNLKFIEDVFQRKERERELIEEIQEIKEEIPVDISVIESREFVKNSLTKDMESIVLGYMEAKSIKSERTSAKKLAELNIRAQNYLVVSTEVKQVQIEHIEYIKELTLVTKSIDLKNNTFSTLLEIIPKEIAENASDVTFITPAAVISEDPIFEISVDDLENEKLIYYINKPVSTDKIQETDTIIFKEFAVNNLITGFFILDDLEIGGWIYYLLIIFLIVVIASMLWYYLRNRKIRQWKKEENVVRALSYIREANNSLERKDIESAKENYHRIKEIFSLLPAGCRKHLNKRISRIRIEIDKKEIFSLLKEFELAKIEQRRQDAEILYKKLQPIYKRIPKKYQQRVYERLKL
jgi:hypothetical protein